MREKTAPDSGDGCGQLIEKHLLELEKITGLTITIHDVNRFFVDAAGNSLLGKRRQSHRRCAICAASPREICISHCVKKTGVEAATADTAYFLHRCHMRITEIVVPLRCNGVHCATLFAGKWKISERKPPPFPLSAKTVRILNRLPRYRESSVREIAGLLTVFGNGIVIGTMQAQPLLSQTRRTVIMELIRKNFAKGISLERISQELCLSPSRTCHLVRELFGTSFMKLLTRERFNHARKLLWATDLPIAEIASEIGIRSEFHFSRMFRKLNGLPPGRYRRLRKGSVEI